MKTIRCAIYTRKSSDEGLDQAFNSLDAQREACEAYIRSQKHEGWKILAARYDDGGASGGTLERTALQRLLEEIDAGRIDMIVVYKIDRLTRSLADFAKLVERLEQAGASFVSVTQQFNTSTSMGRLTLNVLLSFAQFEREVTAERIRDKIAASKKKGMWLGGLVPLGYEKEDSGLVVQTTEAQTVQTLFETYVKLGAVAQLKAFADRSGMRSKTRTFKSGRVMDGKPFSRGALYQLLSNPIYIGKIKHKDELYEGLHKAIIDHDLWDAVQDQLERNAADRKSRKNASNPSLLAGKVFDAGGRSLTPHHACKSGKRYRYYISSDQTLRLPAHELEAAVQAALGSNRELQLRIEQAGKEDIDPTTFVERVEIGAGSLCIHLARSAGLDALTVPYTLRKRGVETKLVLGSSLQRAPDLVLIKRILRATYWIDQIKAGQSLSEIAASEDITPEYITHNIGLGMLSPKILQSIANGVQRSDISAYQLSKRAIPASWPEQDALFLE